MSAKDKLMTVAPPVVSVGGSIRSYSSATQLSPIARPMTMMRSNSPVPIMSDTSTTSSSSSFPPFCLNNPDEYVEIRASNENAESMRLVLEFLYTDQIVSLEGRGEYSRCSCFMSF